MDAAELARWTRFAAKGGIGKCTAVQDCVAQSSEDLMFLKVYLQKYFLECKCLHSVQDDEITVLMQLPEQDNLYLVCVRLNMLHVSHLALGLLRGRGWQIPRGVRPLPLQAQTTRYDQAVVRTLLQVVDTRALPQITLTTDDARRLSVREPIQPRVFKSAWAFP